MSLLVDDHRIKRKLEDRHQDEDDDLLLLLSSTRMRKHEHESSSGSGSIQFFVRTICCDDKRTLVLHGNPSDTIESVLVKIHSLTALPPSQHLLLLYSGRLLHSHHTLFHSNITHDSHLNCLPRMPSTFLPKAQHLSDDLIHIVFSLCKHRQPPAYSTDPRFFTSLKSKLIQFILLIKNKKDDLIPVPVSDYLHIFISSSVPEALVMLYMSSYSGNKECARDSIQHFIDSINKNDLSESVYLKFEPLLLKFCKLLAKAASHHDPLYKSCRTSLGSMVEGVKSDKNSIATYHGGASYNGVVFLVKKYFPFVDQIATTLSETIVNIGPSLSDVSDFAAFMRPLRDAIVDQVGLGTLVLSQYNHKIVFYSDEINYLYVIFRELLEKMQLCLQKVEVYIKEKKEKGLKGDGGWNQYLSILKELHSISQIYKGEEENFWTILRHYKASFCYLIVRYVTRDDDFRWILDHKDVTDFESRRHLVLMLLPEVKNEFGDQLEMLIDRSNLLAESFEYISGAEPEKMLSGLFMEFKNEEATGPGVLREWFFLVCQAIFNPQNALFVACPNDRRRFSPNPASKVDPLHLQYFKFAGRVIALAMMHKMQVGIVFDRVFFLQLGGINICLEDIKDADPFLYSSCKQILDMDPCAVDDDVLGLTFVWEVEELGSMKVFELLPDGKLITVNSRNRKEYIDLIIKHRFVTSIEQQVTEFARGFAEIVATEEMRKLCFKNLELGDLDGMLHGSESPISVDDWKAHTQYNGYKETDRQISWFWKIVGKMTAEQHKVLLFFWTSVKFLPVEGFRGLASRLYIHKSNEKFERLPSSHTCFYQLCFPAYPSMAVMKQRLNLITQDYVGSSFGTW